VHKGAAPREPPERSEGQEHSGPDQWSAAAQFWPKPTETSSGTSNG